MRRLLLPVLLAGAAGCAPEADPRGVARNEVLLQAAATGRSEVRPDEARFTVGVTTQAGTAAAVSAGNNAAANRVVAGLERLEVKADDGGVQGAPIRSDYAVATEAASMAPPRMAAPPPVQAGVDVREVRVRADFALR